MQKNNHKKGALLVVEDNKADQKLLKEAFLSLGISNDIIIANSGEEALKYLKEDDIVPILILCDVNMPGMNGLDLRKEIFKDGELRKKSIPFVFMSSDESEETIELAFEYAVQGYFKKANDFNSAVELLSLIIEYWKTSKLPNAKFDLLKESKKKQKA